MQPLAYFAVRGFLGWLQFLESVDRAFQTSSLLLVAVGAAHCWAVVYALFIAIHTRAMRYDGYHEGYSEHLPFWVHWTEWLAMCSMVIWWAAGFTIAAIRIIEDDAVGLPVDARDTGDNVFVRFLRSPLLQDIISVAHAVSCIGLFVSVVLLCVAMGLMKGSITVCELCICLVATGFAVPHAAVAARRVMPEEKDKAGFGPAAAEAAAAEAATLGPHLCVILALADSPGHAYTWQNMVYIASSVAFAVAVAACGQSPPRLMGSALPPEMNELLTVRVLDIAACAALVLCFPHLNTWYLWVLVIGLLAVFFMVWASWRDLAIDMLDPLFVVRSDTDKALPGKRRQQLRFVGRAAALACAAVALGDIVLHPVQPTYDQLPVGSGGPSSLLWDSSQMLMLRWKTPTQDGLDPTEDQLLMAVAEALTIARERVTIESRLPDHRLLLFKVASTGTEPSWVARMSWKTALSSPKGRLGEIADGTFPAVLNETLCSEVKGTSWEDSPASELLLQAAGPSPEARMAYMAGCKSLAPGSLQAL